MEAQRQLKGRNAFQKQNEADQGTVGRKLQGRTVRGLLNQSVCIGGHVHQMLGTAEGLLKLGAGGGRATLQPRCTPANGIRGHASEQHLELNARQRPTHEVLHKERALSFLCCRPQSSGVHCSDGTTLARLGIGHHPDNESAWRSGTAAQS